MKIFITGASGLLGSNLCYLLKDHYKIDAVYFTHPIQIPGCKISQLDICDEKKLNDYLAVSKPDVIIHTAANASVDDCEKNPEQAFRINVLASESIAKIANSIHARVIYVSTDSVFTEARVKSFREDEPTDPKSVYAKTKLEGEKRVLAESKDALVIRTCIYGFNSIEKVSLAEWILNTLVKGEPVQGFADIYFTPILVNDLGEAIQTAIQKKLKGIFHVASKDAVSKYEFACEIAKQFGIDAFLVQKSSIENSKLHAFRPLRPCLDVSKFEVSTGKELPSMKEGVQHFQALHEAGYHQQIKSLSKSFAKQGK